jgi:hypothetical protein
MKTDKMKSYVAKSEGITLIPIPYWWDKETASLEATIQSYRPDIIDSSQLKAKPIPQEATFKYKR